MPWKKNFDVEEAVRSAMQVFWAKGFEATSMNDLIEATGVQRQSLYNAVGDKRQLFIRALLKYDTEERQATLATLEAQGTPLESLRALYSGVVDACRDPGSQWGCFLVNTTLGLAGSDPEVQLLVKAALEDFRSFLLRLIEHGQIRGEIPSTVDAEAAASGLLAIYMGMKVLVRGIAAEAHLRPMAEQAMRLLE